MEDKIKSLLEQMVEHSIELTNQLVHKYKLNSNLLGLAAAIFDKFDSDNIEQLVAYLNQYSKLSEVIEYSHRLKKIEEGNKFYV